MSIHAKIQKLLALGERGGTEGEAQAAMALAHTLLAKHNLSMAEVESYDANPQEAIITDDSTPSLLRNTQWRDVIYSCVAKLYFCKVYTQKNRRANTRCYCIVGRPSNISIVRFMSEYLIRTCDDLATAGARTVRADNELTTGKRFNSHTWAASFRMGFSIRIARRVEDELRAAREGKVKDEAGTSLVLSPLYDKENRLIAEHMINAGVNPRSKSASFTARSKGGFQAGTTAGDQAALRSNAVAQNSRRGIAG